jgi:ABC-type dipeptide/oligopeptide/nickel transport system ATPase subunit
VDESGTVSLYETTLSDGSVTVVADSTTTVTTDSGSGTTTTTTTNKGDDSVKYGDLDMDGTVDLRDAITLNKALAGQISLSDQATKNADVNCDGGVTDADSSVLIQFCIMLIDSLPFTE